MTLPSGTRPLLRVTEAQATGQLLDPAMRRVLAAFMGQERPLSPVALELGMPLNSLLYRVRQLVGSGLVQLMREEPRAGRARRFYRASAEQFFVPYTSVSAETPERLAWLDEVARSERLIHSLTRAALAGLEVWELEDWGVRFVLDRAGQLVLQYAADATSTPSLLDDRSPALLNLWAEDLDLSFGDAKALQRELTEVLRRYRQRPGGRRYLLRLSLAPSADR